MQKNRIKIEFLGHLGIFDISVLQAKGLKRLFATNTDNGEVTCPEDLITREDLSETDYKLAKDIFNHIWTMDGDNEIVKFKDIKWTASGKVEEIDLQGFLSRFQLEDIVKNVGTVMKNGSIDGAAFLTRFNYDNTNFLDGSK